jgi:oxygen-independent coproporphyrinogen-3 oxidase
LASKKFIAPYIQAVKKEIYLQKNYLNNEIIESIYFGGGTPSLLTINDLSLLLEEVYKNHNLAPDCEITIEANPENLNKDYLKDLHKIGFNRLSIGIQSFFDDDLIYLDRIHNSKQAYTALENAKTSDFRNISIDLIYGIPTLTDEMWISNINKTLEFSISHISAYCLTVENRTPLDFYIKNSKLPEPSEDAAIVQMEILIDLLQKNNYIHYEISNFCKEGFFSKHNSNYWKQKNYLGLGPSAHSYNGISRQWNISNISGYIDALNKSKIEFEYELLTESQRYNEYILTSIRTIWGVDLDKIEKDFGINFLELFIKNSNKLIKDELIEKVGNIYKLTKKGILFADKVALELFSD